MWLMEGRKKLQDGILPVSAIFSLSGHATACQPWLKIQLCLDLATSQYMCSKYHFQGFKTSARNIRKYLKLWQWERGECNTSYQTCFFFFFLPLYLAGFYVFGFLFFCLFFGTTDATSPLRILIWTWDYHGNSRSQQHNHHLLMQIRNAPLPSQFWRKNSNNHLDLWLLWQILYLFQFT